MSEFSQLMGHDRSTGMKIEVLRLSAGAKTEIRLWEQLSTSNKNMNV